MIEVLIFVCGLACGVVLTRYGFGLGVKAVYQIRQDLPLDFKAVEEQSVLIDHTGEEPPNIEK